MGLGSIFSFIFVLLVLEDFYSAWEEPVVPPVKIFCSRF
jgi:hypothetical protein